MHPNPTVVLVHGAWADGSSWSRVIAELQRGGLAVTAAPIPLTSLDDDVNAVIRTIDRTEGPVVLAGHAYAGGVIGATSHPRIQALVYVAALAPDEGETVADVFYRNPPHPQAPELKPDDTAGSGCRTTPFPMPSRTTRPPKNMRCSPRSSGPFTVGSIQKPVPKPGWKDIPTWFLIAEEDRMINPETQHFMAERMHASTQTHQGRPRATDHPAAARHRILEEAVRSL